MRYIRDIKKNALFKNSSCGLSQRKDIKQYKIIQCSGIGPANGGSGFPKQVGLECGMNNSIEIKYVPMRA